MARKKQTKPEAREMTAAEKIHWSRLKKEIDDLANQNEVQLPGTWTIEDYSEFVELMAELFNRDTDAINLYEPLPVAIPFHQCQSREQGLSGSNRAGKTNATAAEIAMAAMGKHFVPGKYPKTKLNIACVGNDERHLALMYSYLFEQPPFQIFLHPETNKWTVVNQNEEEHKKYRAIWQDANPMIPPRLVKHTNWSKKGEQIPKSVYLVNGTKIRFYSGLVRKAPQGVNFNLVWIDEEIENPSRWIKEMRARIAGVNGYIIWSCTPQNASVEFEDMRMLNEHPDNATKPLEQQTGFFVMLASDNKYLSAEGMEGFFEKLKNDEEELMTRYFGKSARNFLVVYPMFNEATHVINDFKLRWEDTRYLIIDPGVAAAAVWLAICPQIDDKCEPWEKPFRTRSDCIILLDELLIKQANPQLVAQSIQMMLAKHPLGWIQDLTIDIKGGRSLNWKDKTPGKTAEELYYDQLMAHGLKPREEGWKYGSSEKVYGITRLGDYLMPSPEDHLPHLFIHSRCKYSIHQFKFWKKTRDARGNINGYEKSGCDLLDCGRYCTTREIGWVPPPAAQGIKPINLKDIREQHKAVLRNMY